MNSPDQTVPPDFDEDFLQALAKWKEQHNIKDDDPILLLMELFRIHQSHWDEIRHRQMPSLKEFSADITAPMLRSRKITLFGPEFSRTPQLDGKAKRPRLVQLPEQFPNWGFFFHAPRARCRFDEGQTVLPRRRGSTLGPFGAFARPRRSFQTIPTADAASSKGCLASARGTHKTFVLSIPAE
jgi:hypothetical protein